MTKLPKIEVWDVDPWLPLGYTRWVMTTDGIITSVSPSWVSTRVDTDHLTEADLIGMSVYGLDLLYDMKAVRDDRTSDS